MISPETCRLADAARTFTDSVELNDRLLVAFVGLSLAQCGDGKPADAMESLNLAVGLVPNSVLLLTESTRLQLKAGRLPQFDFDTAEAHTGLLGVWVLPDHRRRGLATDLADAILEFARENGYKRIRGRLPDGNEPALSFLSGIGAMVPLRNPSMTFELPL